MPALAAAHQGTAPLSAMLRSASSRTFKARALHRVLSSNIPRNASFALRDVLPSAMIGEGTSCWRRWGLAHGSNKTASFVGGGPCTEELELQQKTSQHRVVELQGKSVHHSDESDTEDQPLLVEYSSTRQQPDSPFVISNSKRQLSNSPDAVLENGQQEGTHEELDIGKKRGVAWYKMPQVYVALGGYGLIACTYSFLDEVLCCGLGGSRSLQHSIPNLATALAAVCCCSSIRGRAGLATQPACPPLVVQWCSDYGVCYAGVSEVCLLICSVRQ